MNCWFETSRPTHLCKNDNDDDDVQASIYPVVVVSYFVVLPVVKVGLKRWGNSTFLSLPLPLPLPFPSPPLPSSSFPSPPLPSIPFPPLRSRAPLLRLGGLGERFSSSGSGRGPAAKRYLVNFRLKISPLVATIFKTAIPSECTVSHALTYPSFGVTLNDLGKTV